MKNKYKPKSNKFLIPILGFFLLISSCLQVKTLNAQEQIISPWNITATDTSNYAGITLANGRIGLLAAKEPFKVKSIILNNVFDQIFC